MNIALVYSARTVRLVDPVEYSYVVWGGERQARC
jgi:hypothetical protein